jgi:hypothetical protein
MGRDDGNKQESNGYKDTPDTQVPTSVDTQVSRIPFDDGTGKAVICECYLLPTVNKDLIP